MAVMTITLSEYADNGNSRTFAKSGHSFETSRLVVQSRKQPLGNITVGTTDTNVKFTTVNSDGDLLAALINLGVSSRIPRDAVEADVDEAITLLRDFVAADEFPAMVKAGTYIDQV